MGDSPIWSEQPVDDGDDRIINNGDRMEVGVGMGLRHGTLPEERVDQGHAGAAGGGVREDGNVEARRPGRRHVDGRDDGVLRGPRQRRSVDGDTVDNRVRYSDRNRRRGPNREELNRGQQLQEQQQQRPFDPLPAELAPVIHFTEPSPLTNRGIRSSLDLNMAEVFFRDNPMMVSTDLPQDQQATELSNAEKKRPGRCFLILVLIFVSILTVAVGFGVKKRRSSNTLSNNGGSGLDGDGIDNQGGTNIDGSESRCEVRPIDLRCSKEGSVVIPDCAVDTYRQLLNEFLPVIHPDLYTASIPVKRFFPTEPISKNATDGSATGVQPTEPNSVTCEPDTVALVCLAIATVENPDLVDMEDYYHLALLFLSYKGSSLSRRESEWLSPTMEPCDWRGVKCHSRQSTLPGSRIRRVAIFDEAASGTLPTEIGFLSNLGEYIGVVQRVSLVRGGTHTALFPQQPHSQANVHIHSFELVTLGFPFGVPNRRFIHVKGYSCVRFHSHRDWIAQALA